MRIKIDETSFLDTFGHRQSSDFEVTWRLHLNESVWYDLATGQSYIVDHS